MHFWLILKFFFLIANYIQIQISAKIQIDIVTGLSYSLTQVTQLSWACDFSDSSYPGLAEPNQNLRLSLPRVTWGCYFGWAQLTQGKLSQGVTQSWYNIIQIVNMSSIVTA